MQIIRKMPIPFTQFLPKVLSCITIVQGHNQEIYTDTIHLVYSDITSFNADIYMCGSLYAVLSHMTNSRDHHHSQHTEQVNHKDPSCYPFKATTPPFLPQSHYSQ